VLASLLFIESFSLAIWKDPGILNFRLWRGSHSFSLCGGNYCRFNGISHHYAMDLWDRDIHHRGDYRTIDEVK
jgi:hypothetical protein